MSPESHILRATTEVNRVPTETRSAVVFVPTDSKYRYSTITVVNGRHGCTCTWVYRILDTRCASLNRALVSTAVACFPTFCRRYSLAVYFFFSNGRFQRTTNKTETLSLKTVYLLYNIVGYRCTDGYDHCARRSFRAARTPRDDWGARWEERGP